MEPFNFYFNGRWPRQDEVQDFAYNVLQHFFKYKLKREVDINLTMQTTIPGLTEATCVGDRDSIDIVLSRNYVAADDNMYDYDFRQLLQNLAHELVHAVQFIRGEINGMDNKYRRQDFSDASYRNLPWEHEAWMMEEFLVKLYWDNRAKLELTQMVFGIIK